MRVRILHSDLVSGPVLRLRIVSSKVINFLPSLSPKIRIPNRIIKKNPPPGRLDQLLTHSKHF